LVFFFFFPQVSWMDVPGGEWVLDKVGEKFLLRAMNSVGEYYFNSRDAAENAAEALGMEEITAVLDGTMDKNHCTCRGGIGYARCQHRFTFNDVRSLRAACLTSADPVADQVRALTPHFTTHVNYYLGSTPVCRGFYQKCLGLSTRRVNRISAEVRGEPQVPSMTPPNYNPNPQQKPLCVAFWQCFFGDQCQTSGGGHRYFPINMSCLYIYHNFFYPWWKDATGPSWTEEKKEEGAPPMCDLRLYNAMRPLDPRTFDPAQAFAALCRGPAGVQDEEQEAKHDNAGLSPELDAFHELHQNPDMLFDLIEEAQANQLRHALRREKGFPSFATFMRARYSEEFADVKKREKHFHCRCPTHAALQTKLMQVRNTTHRQILDATGNNYCPTGNNSCPTGNNYCPTGNNYCPTGNNYCPTGNNSCDRK
jgi:hypothetical protein